MLLATPLLTQEYLQSRFTYDEVSGHLLWKSSRFKNKIGTIVGTLDCHGYITISMDYTLYKAHSLIWLLVYGKRVQEIDHIDNNKSNNTLANLRCVSTRENHRNMLNNSPHGHNISRYGKKFLVRASVNSKRVGYGTYDSVLEATLCRDFIESFLDEEDALPSKLEVQLLLKECLDA